MTSIHAKHAKVWQTNDFNAEWIHNAVQYCRKDPDGKRGFQIWLIDQEGVAGARQAMNGCEAPPARRISGRPPSDGLWWAHAAFDLGVSEDGLTLYVNYCNMKELAVPPRVKPAIKRKRGEGSVEWLSRRHEAHLSGHKLPEMDWITARAIALSEFVSVSFNLICIDLKRREDRVRDTWELWHTSPQAFFDELLQRGKTTILSPDVLAKPDKNWVRLHKIDDAFRGRVYSLTLAHMVWLHASELLEDLFNRGLTTSSQIEREYKKDRQLMLRLVACYLKVEGLALHLWSNMTQVITASPNIAPCVIRRRTADGAPEIERNKSPAGRTAYAVLNDLERFTVDIIMKNTRLPDTLCDAWMKELALDSRAADRFDSGTFELIGEMAVVYEFLGQMEYSPFGAGLIECSNTLQATDADLWAALMLPMKRPAAFKQVNKCSGWGAPYLTMVAVRDTWRNVCWRLNMQGMQGPNGLLARIDRRDYLDPVSFDEVWAMYDGVLLTHLAPRTQPGVGQLRALGRHFGLYMLDDPTRPTCVKVLQDQWIKRSVELAAEAKARRDAATRIQVAHPVPVATSHTVAQSGHAYLAEVESANKSEEVPEYLPPEFKLGKKVLKVFHRILAEDDAVVGVEDDASAQKKGQIRWDAFEKAMKRIGFGICQTAGSSVRFDPPAKSARPITFHRPHPDAILTPRLIKWVGARLKRNYGWTALTFTPGANDD
ncbi:hypothetical protein C8R43DRAFT_993497 [Mycena crocata]|nr:hypothetical protein C8R43DRAFT_993497 [Mycena crocata]